MGNLEEMELTAGRIKSVEYIVQPPGRFIIASRGEMILFSVFLGHLHSIGCLLLQPRGTDFVELYYKI